MATANRPRTCQTLGLICTLLFAIVAIFSIWNSWRTAIPLEAHSASGPRDLSDNPPENHVNSTISKRDLISWDESIEKGRSFLCAMEQPENADPRIVPQSTWTSLDDLRRYGWNLGLHGGIQGVFGLDTVFQALRIDTSPQSWRTVNLGHNAATRQSSTNYPATFANFLTLFNGKTPTLIAKMSYGPAYKAKTLKIPIGGNSQLPPLQRWSDLMYLAWQKLTSYDDGSTDQRILDIRANLEHVFRYQVSNQDTKDMFLRAHHGGIIPDPKEILPAWPGWEFTTSSNSDAFKSVLSAPNVFGVVYLLASHKGDEQFRVKSIDRINAFDCPFSLPGRVPEARWCLYIHLAKV